MSGGVVVHDEVVVCPQPTADVARMFGMNLAIWREQPWSRANLDGAELDRLAAELADVQGSTATDEITWHLRQLACPA